MSDDLTKMWVASAEAKARAATRFQEAQRDYALACEQYDFIEAAQWNALVKEARRGVATGYRVVGRELRGMIGGFRIAIWRDGNRLAWEVNPPLRQDFGHVVLPFDGYSETIEGAILLARDILRELGVKVDRD